MVRQGIMDELIINIYRATFHDEPAKIKRCSVGLANYVFIVEIKESKYTVRLSTEKNFGRYISNLQKKIKRFLRKK